MTDVLLDYTSQRPFDEGNDLIELYNALIKDLHPRLNPLKYALITVNVSRQFSSKFTTVNNYRIDLEDAIKFLEEARTRVATKQDAVFILKIAQAEKKLDLGQHHDCIEMLNEVKKSLDALSDVDAKVYANLSRVYA